MGVRGICVFTAAAVLATEGHDNEKLLHYYTIQEIPFSFIHFISSVLYVLNSVL